MGRLLAATLLSVAVAGCYETPKPACQFLCGAGDGCPESYACGADQRCHLVMSNGDLAACTDQLPTIPDASIDAELIDAFYDAEPIDAEPPDATPTCSAFTTSGAGNVFITEVDPGSYIELYNNGVSTTDFSTTTITLHSPGSGATVSAAVTVTIPSGGFRTVAWPVAFTGDNDAGGEILLYTDSTDFTDGTKILDFVPWGTAPGTSRQTIAEANGKWNDTGNRPAALTMGTIQLLTAQDGLDSNDFSISTAADPDNCDP